MSFLGRLFGKGKEDFSGEPGIARHREYLDSLRRPAVRLARSEEGRFNKTGGFPNLPADLPWPQWNGSPLAFLCQLDLSTLPGEGCMPDSPRTGCLHFFYDQRQSTWGFDPKDRGSWRVLYTPHAPQNCQERKPPVGLSTEAIFGEAFVAVHPVLSRPGWEDERVRSLRLTDRQSDEYRELCDSVFEGQPAHQVFGYPSPIQRDDMDLECQLVSAGLYCGDLSGYSDPKAKELEPGKTDWTLLLQLDTDDRTGMMWGDAGMLYFWIRDDDLKARRFEDCWMILQCY